MAKQGNRGRGSRIVVESALTRQTYGGILLLLGLRSWGFGILVAILVFLVWLSADTGQYSVPIIYAGLLVLIYGGAVLASVMSARKRGAYVPVRYTFDEFGLVKEAGKTRQTVRWDALVRWRKVGAYYLIYSSKRSFFVIPRSKLAPGRVDDFEVLLSRRIIRRK
jgi:YcxB-like protein